MPFRLELTDEQYASLSTEQKAHLESIGLSVRSSRPAEPEMFQGRAPKVVSRDDGSENDRRYAEHHQGGRFSDPALFQLPKRYDQ